MGDIKVGELATTTGLTIRTLHYYDEIGLLTPSARSSAGHRLYDATDLERLYRISLLRRLGLRLDQIAAALDDGDWDLQALMSRHVAHLDQQLAVGHRLRSRLARMADAVAGHAQLETRELLETLEDMVMLDTKVQRRVPLVVYSDIEAAHQFLTAVFGLEPGRLNRDAEGNVHHAEVTAGDGVIWLHQAAPSYGLVSTKTAGVDTSMMSVMVEDVDAHYRHAKANGAVIVYEPQDMSYGYREYGARDCEQRLWSFMTPLG